MTEAEQGQAYLEQGQCQAERRRLGYRIDPRPEPKPDGEEPQFKRQCRQARNALRMARRDTAEPDFQAYVEHCREVMREQTAEASRKAGEWLRDQQRRQAESKAAETQETAQEPEPDPATVCRCGRRKKAWATVCFQCANLKDKSGQSRLEAGTLAGTD